MARGLIKLQNYYIEWSTVVDGPVSAAMTKEELVAYTRHLYGQRGIEELEARLERCDRTGTSFLDRNLEDMLETNRAGTNESTATAEQILRECLRERGVPG